MSRRPASGPDPDFPYLSEYDRYSFPSPESWDDSIIAAGGNLSPGMLLSAYEQGLFPWYNPDDPVLWQSPETRFIIFPEKLHVSASMKKILNKGVFSISLDRDFQGVIQGCAAKERPGQDGTWITGDIIAAYTELHRLGWAHSAEAYAEGELVGGCYGIRLGNAFFGESMFARVSNASKAAFLTLARLLFADEIRFIDCQLPSEHLRSLGGTEMGRPEFLALLKETLAPRNVFLGEGRLCSPRGADAADRRGNWGQRYGAQCGAQWK
ncbi:MAG: leucyl/phenylalanyl-tRNA--protein transferase [Treponema sp.]|jgi:leucyl/phenylalanyl-tRNA--protein transferase|nr:leucyl/phenylalanyl-tRNA--protein transferase [Treponema sp.]